MEDIGLARWWWIIGLGFLTWLVPFLASLALFPLEAFSDLLFRTVLILIGLAITFICLMAYLPDVSVDYVFEGWVTGIVWLVMNLGLELFLRYALSMAQQGAFDPIDCLLYNSWTFLYLPITCVACGYIARRVESSCAVHSAEPPSFTLRR